MLYRMAVQMRLVQITAMIVLALLLVASASLVFAGAMKL